MPLAIGAAIAAIRFLVGRLLGVLKAVAILIAGLVALWFAAWKQFLNALMQLAVTTLQYFGVDTDALIAKVSAFVSSLDGLWQFLGVIQSIFPIAQMTAIILAGFAAALVVRFIRWALGLFPTLSLS